MSYVSTEEKISCGVAFGRGEFDCVDLFVKIRKVKTEMRNDRNQTINRGIFISHHL